MEKLRREPAFYAIMSYFTCGVGWLIVGTLSDDRPGIVTFLIGSVGLALATVVTGYCARRCVRLASAAATEHADRMAVLAHDRSERAWAEAGKWRAQAEALQTSLDVSQNNLNILMSATARIAPPT